jgi:hypothetical protein
MARDLDSTDYAIRDAMREVAEEPKGMTLRYVVLVGSLSDGYRCYGPFDDLEDAGRWADDEEEATWLMALVEPGIRPKSEPLPLIVGHRYWIAFRFGKTDHWTGTFLVDDVLEGGKEPAYVLNTENTTTIVARSQVIDAYETDAATAGPYRQA